MKRNWDDLIQLIPYTTLPLLNPDDSLYSKVISINQHLLPKIFFYARIILPTAKQIKSLIFLLFKFLWNFSNFETIKRLTLNLPKSDGGIALPFIGAKAPAAYLRQFIYLLKTPSPSAQFWLTYAIYNLGTKIIPFQLDLYTNSQPHRPNPNPHWKKILTLLAKINAKLEALSKLSFKQLNLHLLKSKTNPLPKLPTNFNPTSTHLAPTHTHQTIFLFFSNYQKEIAFRTIYEGY